MSENWASIQKELETRDLAKRHDDVSQPQKGYFLLKTADGGTSEYFKIDDEFYATVNNFMLPAPQSFAFIGEDWLRIAWMVNVAGDQELLPFGRSRVPSYITPASLEALPGYCDFELQPDSFVKVERFRANTSLKWVSIAMSRRALQRAVGEVDSHIPTELNHYLNRDASVLMMKKSAISPASMAIVCSLFGMPLSGGLRYKFFSSQIHSLLYMTLGNDWTRGNQRVKDNAVQRKISQAAEMLRHSARTTSFNIPDIAREVGLNRSLFDQAFHATYGMPPGRYLVEQKMKYAAELLLAGTMPIRQISMQLGYDHQGSFARCFTRWSKLSPTEFRARHRNDR